MTLQETFVANILRIRAWRGMQAKWLAKQIGISASNYSDLERGIRSVKLNEALAIAEALWLPLEELLHPLTDDDVTRLYSRVRYER